jgi:3-oxoacyl-[acyl-carrier protein] reductase
MSTVRMNDKVVIVTGGARGIGAATAKRLGSLGARVAIVYRQDDQAAAAVVGDIRAKGGHADAFRADVSDLSSVQRMMSEVVSTFGQVDSLVNNAAILETRSLDLVDIAHFERIFRTNVLSVVLVTQAALPHFPATGGHIVNMASSLVFGPIPDYCVYTAAKAAVVSLTLSLSKELGPRKITVNCVSPGLTMTDMTKDLPSSIFDHLKELTPLGRLGTPSDIAEVIAFFSSDAAGWVTGRTIETEGGIN